MKSMCQEVRRNSPSVADCSPTSSCILTTSRMASSSATRSSSAGMRPAAKSSRAFSRAGGAEAAPAAVLDAAERHLRLVVHRLVVDVDDARLQLLGQRQAPVGVAGDDPRRQPVVGVVGPAHRRLRAVDHLDGGDGAERLQLRQLAVGRHVREQGRLEAAAHPLAAGEHAGALGDRVRDATGHRLERALVDQRPDHGAVLARVADLEPGRLGGEPAHELLGDRPVDDDAPGRHADLALVEEGAEGGRLTAYSTSASPSTISGLNPPSSRTMRLRWRPAASASLRPVAVEPVKLSRRTLGFSTSSSPIGPAWPGAWVTMFSAPSGSPASAKISPQSSPPTNGDSSDGLDTTVLPSTSGAAIERADRISAAFQGAIAPTTPTGRRMPMAKAPGTSDGMTWPIGA